MRMEHAQFWWQVLFFSGGDTAFEICTLFVSLRLSLGSPPGSALHSNKLGWNGGGEGKEDGVDTGIQ